MDDAALKRFYLNKCTDSERKEIVRWILNPENDLLIKNWMKDNWELLSELNYIEGNEADFNKIWSNIQEKIKNPKSTKDSYFLSKVNSNLFFKTKRFKKIISIVAVFIFLIGTTIFLSQQFFFSNKEDSNFNQISKRNFGDVIPPSSINAVLILNNGKTIQLDNTKNRVLAKQGRVNIAMDSSGEIIYTGIPSEKMEYNTIIVPKGSKPLKLILSDKTSVWINAASTITYPTVFTGKERRVNVSGEVYFEVAKNALMPFFVTHDSLEIKVLGTHFNVNTYADEKKAKITLIEGAISLSKNSKTLRLKPGDQAQVEKNEVKLASEKANIDEVMAWKNELFYYEGVDLRSIMRQVEKYYNVEVEFHDNLEYKFFAKISRQVNLSEFLKKLELTNLVHFKIEKNKIIVTK
jgi:hypothetical protein